MNQLTLHHFFIIKSFLASLCGVIVKGSSESGKLYIQMWNFSKFRNYFFSESDGYMELDQVDNSYPVFHANFAVNENSPDVTNEGITTENAK